MTSNIESEAFVFDRPRQSAHLPRILLDEYHGVAIPRELVAAREPGRPRTNNYNALSEHRIQDRQSDQSSTTVATPMDTTRSNERKATATLSTVSTRVRSASP